MYKVGQPVVYRLQKSSRQPGPRAVDVYPTPQGDDYVYHVEKHWVVAEVRDDGQLLLRTRRGKTHLVDANDPRLRPANWLERLFYRHRFPRLESLVRL